MFAKATYYAALAASTEKSVAFSTDAEEWPGAFAASVPLVGVIVTFVVAVAFAEDGGISFQPRIQTFWNSSLYLKIAMASMERLQFCNQFASLHVNRNLCQCQVASQFLHHRDEPVLHAQLVAELVGRRIVAVQQQSIGIEAHLQGTLIVQLITHALVGGLNIMTDGVPHHQHGLHQLGHACPEIHSLAPLLQGHYSTCMDRVNRFWQYVHRAG